MLTIRRDQMEAQMNALKAALRRHVERYLEEHLPEKTAALSAEERGAIIEACRVRSAILGLSTMREVARYTAFVVELGAAEAEEILSQGEKSAAEKLDELAAYAADLRARGE